MARVGAGEEEYVPKILQLSKEKVCRLYHIEKGGESIDEQVGRTLRE